MSEATVDDPAWPEQQGPELGDGERRRRWVRVLGVVGGVVAVSLGVAWLTREQIADNVIAGQLRDLGLPGTYRIDSIGPRQQVISRIVIGDPAHPDLTIERATIEIEPRFGFPAIGRVTLVRPRLHGTWTDAGFSFGSLDKVLFGGERTEPFRLPDMTVAVIDARARIDGDHGPIDVKLAGRGALRDGFAGTLAAAAPRLAFGSCAAEAASLTGRIVVTREQPRFIGPVRLAGLDCPEQGLSLRDAGINVDGTADKALDGGGAKLEIFSRAIAYGSNRARGLNGSIEAAYRKGGLTARYDVLGRGLASPQAGIATLAAKGTLRSRDDFARTELEGTLDGAGLMLGEGLVTQLAGWERAADGSLAAPVLHQVRAALEREARGSKLAAEYVVRSTADTFSIVLPQGRLVGGSKDTLLALSRVQYASSDGAPRLAGNFSTGGAGLPRITGRMEQRNGGDTVVTMAMSEYRAGDARLALPRLVVAQTGKGALGFSGMALASGPLPGGRAESLAIPLEGSRSPAGVLSLWRHCATVRFDALAYADLTLERRSLLLCPGPGGAIVRSDARGTRIAVGTPSLDLAGRLGETPIRIASGPVGFGQPGMFYAEALDIALGPDETASRFRLSDLKAEVGHEIAGTFAGTDMKLEAVPLDLLDAAGEWRYADGKLTISDGTFRLEDRTQVDRFQPLTARGATLTLADNIITANALMREPASSHEVVNVAVRHDLGTGRGHAGLTVDGIVFDDALQPDMLSRELLGVVANASGTVRGAGKIDWTPDKVTSSGKFNTDWLDFAAAFGPVKGASGTVVFSDLVNFVTPPGQRLKIASINPGIEVTDGEILFHLQPNSRLAVEGGHWPFLGGTLRLDPVDLNLGVAETRRYVLGIEGLDAAKFVQQMELANLSATGSFDGTLPLVFDENGGRIEGGLLTSRPPGGNVSYVGALTYKDLSPIANFAFDALKSLDYKEMKVAMDGALEGDIVTRVRFDGVRQGAGAKRNFITKRFANLPLRFNINVRAAFYQLITSFKSIYDPAYVKDPRTIGLLDENGRPIGRQGTGVPLVPGNSAGQAPDPRIQPPVSEKQP